MSVLRLVLPTIAQKKKLRVLVPYKKPERDKVFNFSSNSTYLGKLHAKRFFKFGEQANNSPHDRYNRERAYGEYLHRVTFTARPLVVRKSSQPSRHRLQRGSWKQRNEQDYQLYLQRAWQIHTSAANNWDYKPKYFLDSAPHAPHFREQPLFALSHLDGEINIPHDIVSEFSTPPSSRILLVDDRLYPWPLRVPPLDFLHRWLLQRMIWPPSYLFVAPRRHQRQRFLQWAKHKPLRRLPLPRRRMPSTFTPIGKNLYPPRASPSALDGNN